MKKIYLAIAMLFAVFISHAQWNNNGNNSTTGDLTVRNPNNNNASMALSWLDDIPRLRLGGTGNGSANGFEIQSTGNKKLFKVNQAADVFVYGKLGIGTTNPISKLDITNGTYKTYFTGNAMLFKNSNQASYIDKRDAGRLIFRMGENYNHIMTLTSNLNVGIGTTAPETKLDVQGKITAKSEIISKSSNPGLFLNETDIPHKNWHIQVNGGDLKFYEVNDNRSTWNQKMIIKSNGNIGIGTTTPSQKLDVEGIVNANGFSVAGALYSTRITSNSFQFSRNGVSYIDNKKSNGSVAIRSGNRANVDFMVKYNGNVGIGTASPSRLFEIKQKNDSNADSGLMISEPNNSQKVYLHLANNSGGQYGYLGLGGNTILRGNNQQSSFDGRVAIGTTTIPNGFKLAIAGKVISEEVTVKLKSAWPDYVFANDYKLPTLREVENHIKEKGHLANIPSAKEVKENGVKLGEINTKLLEKVEELTLYTIQQEKKLEKQHNEIEELKSLVKQLINTKK